MPEVVAELTQPPSVRRGRKFAPQLLNGPSLHAFDVICAFYLQLAPPLRERLELTRRPQGQEITRGSDHLRFRARPFDLAVLAGPVASLSRNNRCAAHIPPQAV